MKIYVYTIKNGITGVVNGVVFVEHEWEVTCRLADYYSSTEDELIANGKEKVRLQNTKIQTKKNLLENED